jgi:hypothetical protein
MVCAVAGGDFFTRSMGASSSYDRRALYAVGTERIHTRLAAE